jgi:hypothetical protein
MQIDNQIASRRWRSRSADSNHIPGGTHELELCHFSAVGIIDKFSHSQLRRSSEVAPSANEKRAFKKSSIK